VVILYARYPVAVVGQVCLARTDSSVQLDRSNVLLGLEFRKEAFGDVVEICIEGGKSNVGIAVLIHVPFECTLTQRKTLTWSIAPSLAITAPAIWDMIVFSTSLTAV
jgi:hypothetical protein